MTALATCTVCFTPLVPLPDLPDSHPGCSPVDAARWEQVTGSGPRTYTGAMRALVWSTCAGCSRRIEVGDEQRLTEIDGRRVWACAACSSADRALSGPVSVDPYPYTDQHAATASVDLSRPQRPTGADSANGDTRRAA